MSDAEYVAVANEFIARAEARGVGIPVSRCPAELRSFGSDIIDRALACLIQRGMDEGEISPARPN